MAALNEDIDATSDCKYRRTFHSDRGWAYQMNAYRHKLKENKRDDFDIRTEVASDACAVNGYTVSFSNVDSTTKSGRINDIATFITDSVFSEGYDHITKLEDMLTFEADVEVTIYNDTGEAHEVQERYIVPLDLNNR